MQQATGLQVEPFFRKDYSLQRQLPPNLSSLDHISLNLYWSWASGGLDVFRDLDPTLWEKCEQNPRLLLKKISDFRLWQNANEPAYVARVNAFENELRNYLSDEPPEIDKISKENPIAYFCAEYGVHNSLPIYSGGLGILAGDHLKSASDMNTPLVAIGLLYRFGYFRQKISHSGWQEEHYDDALDAELALEPVMDENGQRMLVMIHMRGREVFAQAWLARVGRIKLYLLDTNVPENQDVDRLVTGHLYGGDVETRIVQEKILGIGGVRLLRKLGVWPSVYHLNEGHSAFLTLELAREILEQNPELDFLDAMVKVRNNCVFTTHTPVAAGNDNFPIETINDCFSKEFIDGLKLGRDNFITLGRTNADDKLEWFGMTPLALRMCRSANGVSKKHGQVSRGLWHKMFPQVVDEKEVPISHITNGVHAPTWIAPTFKALFENRFGKNWTETLRNNEQWSNAIDTLSDEEIWNSHSLLKRQLISYIRQRTYARDTGNVDTIHEHSDVKDLFDPNALTIGFARRIAAYKRWDLLLHDTERFLRMIDNADRPVQFVFAGKAHPQDNTAKSMLQSLMHLKNNAVWEQRAVFIEDYDQEVARYLVQGVDVWLNVPRRPLEASGTSGQKAAMNGVLNLSILDGWWIEGYDGKNGFAIGTETDGTADDEKTIDTQDAEALYNALENDVIPTFYSKDETGLPREWIARMRQALKTLAPGFSSDRMVKDYIDKIYLGYTV